MSKGQGSWKVCRNGHKYTAGNTAIRIQKGNPYQQCVECRELSYARHHRARHQRAGTKPWVTEETCRSRRHKRTEENTVLRNNGTIFCKDCHRESVSIRRRKIARIPCQVRGCESGTQRTDGSGMYVCPTHRAKPPASLVSLLRVIGRLDLLAA